ncbi:ABC transporter related protein [Emticicia oligotrophica DSM 17448]|uniref:ABC transporter related protein n=1 Tax=Emticicia oligotrophica (strain DSM 17448 / CIP 109782 / MTCC 6937 / GPTSA100-15) TaxID=929562 RepID=A0ABM5N1N1_EMTOG|nr:ATP-binding cassette domain-containing protein [Emticicia oligotrophica]AFK03272.1 ABC transporter related protein [Emticicia oligotrophica DSM 17448]
MITFEEVSIQKGDRTVLENINWQVNANENWAIVGGNGSGKSTLLEAVAGKIFPTKGRISKPNYDEIAFVARDYSFNRIVESATQYYQQRFNSMDAEIAPTVREILQNQVKPIGTVDEKSVDLPPLPYTEEELIKTANLLKINHLLERKIVTLSNGETRRTLITLSLLRRPKVLILDNPFVGLDIESRGILHQVLNQVAAAGIMILMVTTPKEIPSCITNILQLQEGKIKRTSTQPADYQQVIHNSTIQINTDILSLIKQNPTRNDFDYALNLRNVTVTYKGVNVVDGVSWAVKRGEKWALMGPNGSGKSTILSLITADNPQGYQNDYDLFDRKRGSGESIWDIKHRIGYVSPELHLYFTRNTEVWKAVASGLFDSAGLFKKLSDEERNTTDNYLSLLNIKHLTDRKIYQLSTGEQRQVFLARALVKNPPLLLLDEPCQGLDYEHIVYFRDLVNKLVLELDKTLIYVTHYEEEIPACVDKRLSINKGKVIN